MGFVMRCNNQAIPNQIIVTGLSASGATNDSRVIIKGASNPDFEGGVPFLIETQT